MLTKEEIELIKKGVVWEIGLSRSPGGQSVGIPSRDVILKYPELSFEIRIGNARSQHQNREMCMTLFELFLSTLR